MLECNLEMNITLIQNGKDVRTDSSYTKISMEGKHDNIQRNQIKHPVFQVVVIYS